MVHFMASMPLVVDAVVLLHRSGRRLRAGIGEPAGAPAGPPPRPRDCSVLLGLVLAAGTATTGAGPTPAAQGQVVAKRLPVALRDMAELHSTLAVLLVGVTSPWPSPCTPWTCPNGSAGRRGSS